MEKINNINLEPEEDKNILKKTTESIERAAGKVSESFDHSKLKIKTIDKIKLEQHKAAEKTALHQKNTR
jgi:hypothetical protein